MSTVIYTANIGSYDKTSPLFIDGVKYFRYTKPIEGSPRLQARYHKTHPPKGYDINVWIDGSVICKNEDAEVFSELLGDNDIVGFRHPYRDCLYKEADVCRKMRHVVPKEMTDVFKHDGFPENYGLFGTGILIRRSSTTEEFNKLWWWYIRWRSMRDQTSCMYALWKTGVKWGYMEGDLYDNKYFKVNRHAKKHIGKTRSI